MDELGQRIAELAAGGTTRSEIAERLEVTEATVTERAGRYGIATRKKGHLTTDAERLVRLSIDAEGADTFEASIDAATAIAGLSAHYVADLVANLRTGEAAFRRLRQRLEALQNGDPERACPVCGSPVAGRSDARYCSTACRVRAHRRKESPDPMPSTTA